MRCGGGVRFDDLRGRRGLRCGSGVRLDDCCGGRGLRRRRGRDGGLDGLRGGCGLRRGRSGRRFGRLRRGRCRRLRRGLRGGRCRRLRRGRGRFVFGGGARRRDLRRRLDGADGRLCRCGRNLRRCGGELCRVGGGGSSSRGSRGGVTLSGFALVRRFCGGRRFHPARRARLPAAGIGHVDDIARLVAERADVGLGGENKTDQRRIGIQFAGNFRHRRRQRRLGVGKIESERRVKIQTSDDPCRDWRTPKSGSAHRKRSA